MSRTANLSFSSTGCSNKFCQFPCVYTRVKKFVQAKTAKGGGEKMRISGHVHPSFHLVLFHICLPLLKDKRAARIGSLFRIRNSILLLGQNRGQSKPKSNYPASFIPGKLPFSQQLICPSTLLNPEAFKRVRLQLLSFPTKMIIHCRPIFLQAVGKGKTVLSHIKRGKKNLQPTRAEWMVALGKELIHNRQDTV